MRVVSLLVALGLTASPAIAQQRFDSLPEDRPQPIRASIEKVAEAGAQPSAAPTIGRESTRKRGLFWSGLALGVAGVTTSALGLTAFRTENSSTGNAPSGTYLACVAQRDSNPIYVTNQCDPLKGKNLKLLWGGVALGGAGAALMIGGFNTSAELSPGAIGLFHHLHF
jgi:hypothetical protein